MRLCCGMTNYSPLFHCFRDNFCHLINEYCCRRLVKRVYVPLPDEEARRSLLIMLLSKQAKTQQKDSNGSSGVGGQSISTPSSNSGNNNNSSSSGGCDNGGGGNSFSNTVFGVFSNSSKSNNPTNTAANLRGCLLENGQQVDHIVRLTAGYSASDLTAVTYSIVFCDSSSSSNSNNDINYNFFPLL